MTSTRGEALLLWLLAAMFVVLAALVALLVLQDVLRERRVSPPVPTDADDEDGR